jgi:hypothetical protein
LRSGFRATRRQASAGAHAATAAEAAEAAVAHWARLQQGSNGHMKLQMHAKVTDHMFGNDLVASEALHTFSKQSWW